jgi:hypothetical protein
MNQISKTLHWSVSRHKTKTDQTQGSQIFLGTIYEYGKNIPHVHKIHIPNDHKNTNGLQIDQMAIKYTNILNRKTLPN